MFMLLLWLLTGLLLVLVALVELCCMFWYGCHCCFYINFYFVVCYFYLSGLWELGRSILLYILYVGWCWESLVSLGLGGLSDSFSRFEVPTSPSPAQELCCFSLGLGFFCLLVAFLYAGFRHPVRVEIGFCFIAVGSVVVFVLGSIEQSWRCALGLESSIAWKPWRDHSYVACLTTKDHCAPKYYKARFTKIALVQLPIAQIAREALYKIPLHVVGYRWQEYCKENPLVELFLPKSCSQMKIFLGVLLKHRPEC